MNQVTPVQEEQKALVGNGLVRESQADATEFTNMIESSEQLIKLDDNKKSHESLEKAEDGALMSSGIPEFDNDVTRPR